MLLYTHRILLHSALQVPIVQPGIETLPLILLLFIHLLYLSVFKGELHGFHLGFLRLLNVLRVVGLDLELLWYFQFVQIFELVLLVGFIIGCFELSQSVELHDLLRVILFVFHMIVLPIHLLYHTRVELPILRVNSLAESRLFESVRVRGF